MATAWLNIFEILDFATYTNNYFTPGLGARGWVPGW